MEEKKAYQVSARKYRPLKFADVVGQEHITKTLQNAITNKRIAHAYLFTGPRGVGKTTTARIFAKAINCENLIDGEPCNECVMCKSIGDNQSLDFIEIDGASNRGIDEIRTLRDSVKYAPTVGKYKVYIIDEVHMLTKESFNAFLKTLEEPPEHTIFIFATTDVHKVPLTIISRCQRFDFRRIQIDTIKNLLIKIAIDQKVSIDDKTLTIIAKKADGALRDAESLFDQVVSFCGNNVDSETVIQMLNLIDEEIYFDLTNAIIKKDFKAVFDITDKLYDNGWNFIDFMGGLIEHFRNVLTVIVTDSSKLIESAEIYKEKYLEYSDKFSEADILRILNFLNQNQNDLKFSSSQKLKIEIILSHLVGFEKTELISNVINNIQNSSSDSGSGNIVNEKPPEKFFASPKHEINQEQKAHYNTRKIVTEKEALVKPINEFSDSVNVSSNNLTDIDSIINKWQGFTASVADEKYLSLGPFMHQLKILNVNGNKLEVKIDSEEGKDAIRFHSEYLTKKAFEVFGKRYSFSIGEEKQEKPLPKKETAVQNPSISNSGDPFIDLIKNELNGQEIE